MLEVNWTVLKSIRISNLSFCSSTEVVGAVSFRLMTGWCYYSWKSDFVHSLNFSIIYLEFLVWVICSIPEYSKCSLAWIHWSVIWIKPALQLLHVVLQRAWELFHASTTAQQVCVTQIQNCIHAFTNLTNITETPNQQQCPNTEPGGAPHSSFHFLVWHASTHYFTPRDARCPPDCLVYCWLRACACGLFHQLLLPAAVFRRCVWLESLLWWNSNGSVSAGSHN